MAIKPDRQLMLSTYEYFCDSVVERGEFVSLKNGTDIVYPYHKVANKRGYTIIGMSLCDVVHIDFMYTDSEVAMGSKIEIMQAGVITVDCDNDEIQSGDFLYIDRETGMVTNERFYEKKVFWFFKKKIQNELVGKALSNTNDGWVKMRLDV